MRIEFDTENLQDVAYVRQLLGVPENNPPATPAAAVDIADYVTFIQTTKIWEAGRRPHMIEFIEQAKATYGLTSEIQPASARVSLRLGNTPVVQVFTSGRVLFRIVPDSRPTSNSLLVPGSPSDTRMGWGLAAFLDSADHVKAALDATGKVVEQHR